MLMRIVYDRQLQGIEPLYWCVGQEWNLMQEQECRCKASQPPPLPLLPPSYRCQFFLDFPVHAALCTKGMRAATPSQRRRHPAGLRAGVDSAQRVHHSVVTGIGRKLESMHKFTESAHPQHNYALARAQRPAKMRPRAARPRAQQALAFSFFPKLTKLKVVKVVRKVNERTCVRERTVFDLGKIQILAVRGMLGAGRQGCAAVQRGAHAALSAGFRLNRHNECMIEARMPVKS